MSEISNRPVDNGERVQVTSTFFTGMAGVRWTESGGEFACISKKAFLRGTAAIVDGRKVAILSVRKSDISDGILVAQFELQGDA